MAADSLDPTESFRARLLRRVVRAVEAGKVSGDLPTEFQTEIPGATDGTKLRLLGSGAFRLGYADWRAIPAPVPLTSDTEGERRCS